MGRFAEKLLSPKSIAITAGVTLATMIVLEVLAIKGVWDWRDIPNAISGSPKPMGGSVPQEGGAA